MKKHRTVKADDAVRGMTRKEFADYKGKTRQCVDAWVREGKVTLNKDGSIDPMRADVELLQSSKKSNAEYMRELARKTGLQADRLALDLTARRGALISAEEAFSFWEFTVLNLKSRLRGLPTKLASRLASETRPAGCQHLLLVEIDNLLTEMVGTIHSWQHWPNGRTLEELNGKKESRTNSRPSSTQPVIPENSARPGSDLRHYPR